MQIWLTGKSIEERRNLGSRGSSDGFTLLELIVVLTIIGVAVAFTLPSIGTGLRHWHLQEAVREVATLLKFARHQSVATRRPLQVVMDRGVSLYWLDTADEVTNYERANERGIRLYALPAGIRFGEVTFGGRTVDREEVGFVFFPRGSSMGGEVQILDEGGRGYRIVLDTVTGRTHVARLGN